MLATTTKTSTCGSSTQTLKYRLHPLQEQKLSSKYTFSGEGSFKPHANYVHQLSPYYLAKKTPPKQTKKTQKVTYKIKKI